MLKLSYYIVSRFMRMVFGQTENGLIFFCQNQKIGRQIHLLNIKTFVFRIQFFNNRLWRAVKVNTNTARRRTFLQLRFFPTIVLLSPLK